MKARIDYECSEALRGMYQLEHYIHNSGLEESLVHLVKMRASQINGCAYCLDGIRRRRALGETEQRLFVLDAWEKRRFIPSANARRSRLPRPSLASRKPCARRGIRARTSALQRTGADCAGVYPDHHQRLEPPCYHDAY